MKRKTLNPTPRQAIVYQQKASRQIEAREQLDALLQLEDDELNEWEVEFVETLSHQKGALSDKQISKLEQIHQEKNK